LTLGITSGWRQRYCLRVILGQPEEDTSLPVNALAAKWRSCRTALTTKARLGDQPGGLFVS